MRVSTDERSFSEGNKIKTALPLLLCLAITDLAYARSEGNAARMTDLPVVDGIVIGDSAWSAAPSLTQFTQVQPYEGQPASERTEVYIGYTDDTLYVGVVCYDDAPEKIIVSNTASQTVIAGRAIQ